MMREHTIVAAALIVALGFWSAEAFSLSPSLTTISRRSPASMVCRTATKEDKSISFLDWIENNLESGDDEDGDGPAPIKVKKPSRWDSLNPKIKQRLVEKGQAKAIANKAKRESKHTKKRRAMMYVKKQQRERKYQARVERPLKFNERTPLAEYAPGSQHDGVVISLTDFGAYVDIGTEVDGLLHVSQITRDHFVEHPRQELSPGDEVTVTVRSVNPEKRKLHLTMLDLEQEEEEEDDDEESIPLEDLEIDDELWGEIKRVTDFGAYVDVGAEVHGFLHFMDHPLWEYGSRPYEFMERGQRVRIWVMDVDLEMRRVKLSANRPTSLPGPRREF